MKNPNLLIIINLIAFIAVLVMNTLANSLPLNGHTPGQLSDMYPNLFVPAGITFSIWGVIYTWLLVFMGIQVVALFSKKLSEKVFPWVLRLGNYFVQSSLLNIAWLFAWHWQLMGLSVLIMFCLLATLLHTSIAVGIGNAKYNTQEKWLVHAPFGIYLGWISIATIANITAFLVSIKWQAWGISEFHWTTTMIIIGTVIALFVVVVRNNIFYGMAVIWALIGIGIKRESIADPISMAIIPYTEVCIIVLVIGIVFRLKKWLSY